MQEALLALSFEADAKTTLQGPLLIAVPLAGHNTLCSSALPGRDHLPGEGFLEAAKPHRLVCTCASLPLGQDAGGSTQQV